jgi:UDP-N-acetylmuramate--alanine ligase
MDVFADSLCGADLVIVTGIYKSREEKIPGVDSASIVLKIKERGHIRATYVEKKEDIVERLAPALRDGDAVIIMGAGDIGEICGPLLVRIRNE